MGRTVLSGGLGVPRGDERFLAPVANKCDPEKAKKQLLGDMSVPIGEKIERVCAEGTGE